MPKRSPEQELRYLLDTGAGLTLLNIQTRFQLSERHARRLIRQLEQTGLPITEQRDGKRKVFTLPAENQQMALPDLRFDSAELRALTIAAKASRSVLAGTPHAVALGSAFGKLLDRARPISYLFDLDEPTQEWHFDENAPDAISLDSFRQLEQAMDERRSVRMDYLTGKDGRASTGRKVDPYFFAKRQRAWMLVAYCHKRETQLTFALTRIGKVIPCDDATEDSFFEIPDDFVPEDFFQPSLGAITSGECFVLRLLVEPDKVLYFRQRKYHETQEIEEERPDGRLVVSYELEGLPEIRSFCQGWGVGITVLEPPILRDLLHREAVELTRRYGAEMG